MITIKKWFREDTFEPQNIPLDIVRILRPDLSEEILNNEVAKEKFSVLKVILTEGYSVQITYNMANRTNNNFYTAFGFDKNDLLFFAINISSHTVVPPVWDRFSGKMDYLDWLSVQNKLKKLVPELGLEVDESLGINNDFMFYKEGRNNDAHLCLFADKVPDLVKAAKEFCLREYS